MSAPPDTDSANEKGLGAWTHALAAAGLAFLIAGALYVALEGTPMDEPSTVSRAAVHADGLTSSDRDRSAEQGETGTGSASGRNPTPRDKTDYDRAVAALHRQIETTARLAGPGDLVRGASLAASLVSLGQLTGDYDAFARAEKVLERVFADAPEGAGPFLVRARLHHTLHRFEAAEADLLRAEEHPMVPGTSAEIAGLLGDIAFNSGDYAGALARYTSVKTPDYGTLARLAFYHSRTGDFRQAEALYDSAEKLLRVSERRARAWLHLQRGLMDLDRGRYEDALEHYRSANDAFNGYWLIEEHMAEIDALEGRVDKAIAAYRQLVERTGNPEFMDALVPLLEVEAPDESLRWKRRAREAYEARLRRFPEATYGHALGHFLELEGDPARALELAEKNHALRPGGEAKTRFAQAALEAGRVDQAKALVEAALATPWRTADLHATAALVYARIGDIGREQQQRKLARAIHPHALEGLAWLR